LVEKKELYFKFHGQQLQLKMIHLDFEKAAHNAVLEVFENCKVVGCRFHLSQAWFRRIKNDKELNKHYAGKTVVYQWLQSFFGLSYLPLHVRLLSEQHVCFPYRSAFIASIA
jgi:hypothetical protein